MSKDNISLKKELIMKNPLKISFLLSLLSLNASQQYPQHSLLYYSQYKQDQFLVEHVFHHKKNGVFFDIGAHDGISLSNTYYFEKELGWTGICVEPQDENFQLLAKNRNCICLHGGIFDTEGELEFVKVNGPSEMLSGLAQTYDPRHLKRAQLEIAQLGGSIEIVKIKTFLFNDVCAKNNITHIDFLSVDTEGSEEKILHSIDFEHINISVIAVENNYKENTIKLFLETKGYMLLCKVGCDDIYIKKADFDWEQ